MTENLEDQTTTEARAFELHDTVICTSLHNHNYGRIGRVIKPDRSADPDLPPTPPDHVHVVFDAESLAYRMARMDVPVSQLKLLDKALRMSVEVPPVEEMGVIHDIFDDIRSAFGKFELDWDGVLAAWARSREVISKQYPEADPVKAKELIRTLFLWRMKLDLVHQINVSVVEPSMGERIVPPMPPHVVWS